MENMIFFFFRCLEYNLITGLVDYVSINLFNSINKRT